MKMLTRKVGKRNKRINTRKSNKKYTNKRRKYTHKGRGLGDAVKKVYSSASKSASKITRGPTDRGTMRKLQEEIASRKIRSDRITQDCPLCLETSMPPVFPITATAEEGARILKENDMCQPCTKCAHPFHIGCVEEMYDKTGKKSSICPLCRDESFREFQNKNYVTKRLQENKDKLAKLQSELREMGNLKGPPPPRYNEIQSILKDLELDIQCDTDLLDPNISEDEYIKRWPRS